MSAPRSSATMVVHDPRTARLAVLKEMLGVSLRLSVVVAHLNDLDLRFPLDIRRSMDVFSVVLGRSPRTGFTEGKRNGTGNRQVVQRRQGLRLHRTRRRRR